RTELCQESREHGTAGGRQTQSRAACGRGGGCSPIGGFRGTCGAVGGEGRAPGTYWCLGDSSARGAAPPRGTMIFHGRSLRIRSSPHRTWLPTRGESSWPTEPTKSDTHKPWPISEP